MSALLPILDSSALTGSQELPENEAETDLSPRLPAAHIISKDLTNMKSPRMLVLLAHN